MSKMPIVSRRKFIESSAAFLAATSFAPTLRSFASEGSNNNVIAGAIRWDAWYKKADDSVHAQHTLSTEKYYRRAPFYCSVAADSEVTCVGTPAEMDAEIHAAAKAGLKYWAFDWYLPDSSLRTGWALYNQSSFRDLINWAGIVGLDKLGSVPFSNDKWQANVHEWAEYMRQPNYQKVTIEGGKRPLLYILWDQYQVKWYFDNDLANVRKCFALLRQTLADAGIGAPYVVILDGTDGAPIAREIGADAISNYISGFRHEQVGPYADLDKQAQEFWAKMAATGVPTVPIAMVGWDTRPRQERPVPWEHGEPNPNPTLYYVPPTPVELAAHVRAAVDFIGSHHSECPSKVLLIYSWDECDEGGGLIPSLGDPKGSLLSAIAPIIS